MTASTHSTESTDWETLTVTCTQWTVLVKQLEDLLTLQCLLKMKVANQHVSPSAEPVTVSIKKVLSGGKGKTNNGVSLKLAVNYTQASSTVTP